MTSAILKFAIIALGVVVLAIGLGIFLFGPEVVGNLSTSILGSVWSASFTDKPSGWTANSDSELRFYSVFWVAYGACLLWVARELAVRTKFLLGLLTLFFLGGVGRVVSIFQVGWPHPLFVVLMSVELILPPILLVVCWLAERKGRRD